jgi:hypothetical protein
VQSVGMVTLIEDGLGNTHLGDEITDLVASASPRCHGNRLHGHGNVVTPFLTGSMVHSDKSRLTGSKLLCTATRAPCQFFWVACPGFAPNSKPNLKKCSFRLGSVSGSIWCNLHVSKTRICISPQCNQISLECRLYSSSTMEAVEILGA